RIAERDLFYDRMVSSVAWDDVTNTYETRRRLKIVFGTLFEGIELEGASFLDAGSGGGHFSQLATECGACVTSLDMGVNLLREVERRCASHRVVGSVLELPFPGGSFDIVLCTEVIEHTPDPRAALREVTRLVRPGGTLVVTTPG